MPRYDKPMKDVVADEMLRGAGKQALIRRCPNGETYAVEDGMPYARGRVLCGKRVK